MSITTRCKMVFLNGRPVPKLCECSAYQRIGGNGSNVGSFFFDSTHSEWVCCGCGRVLDKYGR